MDRCRRVGIYTGSATWSGKGSSVLHSRGSDNFCMVLLKEDASVSFQFAAFPRTPSPALPFPSPPIPGEAVKGTQHLLSSLSSGTRREQSPIEAPDTFPSGIRALVDASVPVLRGLRWAPAPPPAGMSVQSVPPASRLAPSRHREKVAVRDAAAAMTTPAVGARARLGCSREEGGSEAGGGF